jgi:hypothetical protein
MPAPFPSALAIFNGDAATVTNLREAFADAWFVPKTAAFQYTG